MKSRWCSSWEDGVTRWNHVGATIGHQLGQAGGRAVAFQRHADHCVVDDIGCAVIDAGLPDLELPVRRVAGAAHDPVPIGREHLQEMGLAVDGQSFERCARPRVLRLHQGAVRGAGDQLLERRSDPRFGRFIAHERPSISAGRSAGRRPPQQTISDGIRSAAANVVDCVKPAATRCGRRVRAGSKYWAQKRVCGHESVNHSGPKTLQWSRSPRIEWRATVRIDPKLRGRKWTGKLTRKLVAVLSLLRSVLRLESSPSRRRKGSTLPRPRAAQRD